MKRGRLSKIFTGLIYFCLYLPIAVMMLFSFNASKSMTNFTGFSLRWYRELFTSGKAFDSLKYSLIIAVLSAVIATLIGTLAAYGIYHMRRKALRSAVMSVTNIPMMNPDIVTGISMLLLFAFIQAMLGMQKSLLGFGTLLIAHVTFNIPYVILSVLPKFKQMDPNLSEAALDLGCTPVQTFFKVELPSVIPGIVSGAIMAFTLSLDDFVISNFTIGNSFQTLPILIYSMTKREVTPDMNALCSIMFVVIFALLLISNLIKVDENGTSERRQRRNGFLTKPAGRIAVLCVGLAVVGGLICAVIFSSPEVEKTISVYNWGEYISDGSDDSMDVIAEFEKWYEEEYGEKVRVNYTTYSSNEDLYNKLKSGATDYDVIIPSDYMIARMREEGMLEELDMSLIPNFEENISPEFKGLYYDPENRYAVPYTYGTMGIIYDTGAVDEADVTGWDILWNSKYSGSILQFNNPRDAFGLAMYDKGIDVNSTDPADWQTAYEHLAAQKPLVQSYVMDEIYNKMESGEAAVSTYYAGDFLFMYCENDALAFCQPDQTNYFIDAMCIPKNPARSEDSYRIANIFINYMLSEEPAVANAETICYASPNRLVRENDEYREYMADIHEDAMDILYPEDLDFGKAYKEFCYRALDSETNELMNSLWSRLKIASDENDTDPTNLIALIVFAVILLTVAVGIGVRRKRARYY
jgi:spermidine/putrescine transport system permease protein